MIVDLCNCGSCRAGYRIMLSVKLLHWTLSLGGFFL